MKIAIVGAGITGCLLTEFLTSSANANEITIFEKSRGLGGRASTKRMEWGQFDLGATIVPAKSAHFIQFMQALCKQKVASPWPNKIYSIEKTAEVLQPIQNVSSDRHSFIFNHKMNAACKHWIDNGKLFTNSLVSEIRHKDGQGWQVKIDEVWHTEYFDKIVLTAPWPQNQQIIENSLLLFDLPSFIHSWTSCWSVAIKVSQKVAKDIDLIYLKGLPIQILVRDSAKPNRPEVDSLEPNSQSEIWVAQLTNALSDSLSKEGKEQAIELANNTFCELFDVARHKICHNYAHYWRFARPIAGQTPLGIISQPNIGLYAAGDWSFGASIEAAYEAAKSLTQTILAE